MGIMRAKKSVSVWKYFHFDLRQTRKNKNPDKNFFALKNFIHYNDINRYFYQFIFFRRKETLFFIFAKREKLSKPVRSARPRI